MLTRKILFSLLLATVVFALFAVAAYSGLFDLIDTRLYDQRVRSHAAARLDSVVTEVENYRRGIVQSLAELVDRRSIRTVFRVNQSLTDIRDRQAALAAFAELHPEFDFVRFVDNTRAQLWFSSLASDIATRQAGQVTYQSVESLEPALDLPAADQEGLRWFGRRGAVQISVQVLETNNAPQGLALAWFRLSSLTRQLVDEGWIGPSEQVQLAGDGTLIVNARRHFTDADREAIVQALAQDGATALVRSELGQEFALVRHEAQRGLPAAVLLVSSDRLRMDPVLRGILLVGSFVITFLLVFLLFNLRQDPAIVIAERFRRFQQALVRDLLATKGSTDPELWRRELEVRREKIDAQLRRGIGRLRGDRQAEVEGTIARSWNEMHQVLGGGERSQTMQPEAVNLSRIQQIIEQTISRYDPSLATQSGGVGGRSNPQAESRPIRADLEPAEVEELAVIDAEPVEAEELAAIDAEPMEAEELEVIDAEPVEAEELAAIDAEPMEAEELEVIDAEPVEAEELAVIDAEPMEAEELEVIDAEPVEAEELAAIDAEPVEAEELAAIDAQAVEAEELAAIDAQPVEAEELAAIDAEPVEAEELAVIDAQAVEEAEGLAVIDAEPVEAEELAVIDAQAVEEAEELAAVDAEHDATEPIDLEPLAPASIQQSLLGVSGEFGIMRFGGSQELPSNTRVTVHPAQKPLYSIHGLTNSDAFQLVDVDDFAALLVRNSKVIEERGGLPYIDTSAFTRKSPRIDLQTQTLAYQIIAHRNEASFDEVLQSRYGDLDLDDVLGKSANKHPTGNETPPNSLAIGYGGFDLGVGSTDGSEHEVYRRLVRLIQRWDARSACILDRQDDAGWSAHFSIGMPQSCPSVFSLAPDTELAHNVFDLKRVLLLKCPLSTLRDFDGDCHAEQLELIRSWLWVPLEHHGGRYLMVGFARSFENLVDLSTRTQIVAEAV